MTRIFHCNSFITLSIKCEAAKVNFETTPCEALSIYFEFVQDDYPTLIFLKLHNDFKYATLLIKYFCIDDLLSACALLHECSGKPLNYRGQNRDVD